MNDLISRQAAIEHFRCTDPAGTFAYCDSIIDFLENLPSAQPDVARDIATIIENEQDMRVMLASKPSAQQWIPVTERLPKVGRTVICQCRADILKLLKLDSGGDWYQDAEHAYMRGFVIAWMPLPEPYKGEES